MSGRVPSFGSHTLLFFSCLLRLFTGLVVPSHSPSWSGSEFLFSPARTFLSPSPFFGVSGGTRKRPKGPRWCLKRRRRKRVTGSLGHRLLPTTLSDTWQGTTESGRRWIKGRHLYFADTCPDVLPGGQTFSPSRMSVPRPSHLHYPDVPLPGSRTRNSRKGRDP